MLSNSKASFADKKNSITRSFAIAQDNSGVKQRKAGNIPGLSLLMWRS